MASYSYLVSETLLELIEVHLPKNACIHLLQVSTFRNNHTTRLNGAATYLFVATFPTGASIWGEGGYNTKYLKHTVQCQLSEQVGVILLKCIANQFLFN